MTRDWAMVEGVELGFFDDVYLGCSSFHRAASCLESREGQGWDTGAAEGFAARGVAMGL